MFFVKGIVVQLSLDSGCEGDCIHVDECKRLGIPILPLDSTDTQPMQADGHSPLEILGKVKFTCTRDKIILHFEGYVARNIQAPILCGGSFLSRNKITQELHNNKIVIDGKFHIMESSPFCPNPIPTVQVSHIKNFQPSLNTQPEDATKQDLNKIFVEDSVPKHLKEKLNAIHQKHIKVLIQIWEEVTTTILVTLKLISTS